MFTHAACKVAEKDVILRLFWKDPNAEGSIGEGFLDNADEL